MRVDDCRPDAQGHPKRPVRERRVEVDLMPRRPHHGALDPRHIPRAVNLQARHIVAIVVGADDHSMPELLQGPRLLPDPNMAAIIGKKACRRDHEDGMEQSRVPSLTLQIVNCKL